MVRYGMVAVTIDGETHNVRLQLTEEHLNLQREELAYTSSRTDHIDAAVLAKERIVQIRREKVGGLGLSVKGGAEHNLPVLVSRIFKDQAAYNTGQIFVGDAIIKVNNMNIENFSHDDAVSMLKNAGDSVVLVLKYFQSASLFLAKAATNSQMEADSDNNQTLPEDDYSERQWNDIATVPLLCSRLTRYKSGTDLIRTDGFELISADGIRSDVVQVTDADGLQDWIDCITRNMTALCNHFILTTNKQLPTTEQIVHLCWTYERSDYTDPSTSWRESFLALKGMQVIFYDSVPLELDHWKKYDTSYNIYECVLRVTKENELLDKRRHAFTIESGQGSIHYFSVESRADLQRLEKAWYRANYQAVRQIASKSFACTWRKQDCQLTLDLNSGFSLYECHSKKYLWTYKFSQLKGSSDDGRSLLKFHFLNSELDRLESRELECRHLQTVVYCMHAFLSAKLASVDPCYLMNL